MKVSFTFISLVLFISIANAQIPITAVNTSNSPASSSSSYTNSGMTYNWGAAPNNNEVLVDGFTAGGLAYSYLGTLTGNIKLRRVDNAMVTGNYTLLWAEAVNTASEYNMFPAYKNDMESILNNHIYNMGTDNLFSNTTTNANNIERLDWILSAPYSTPVPDKIGFAIFERGNDNQHDPFCIAAITALDGSGNPSAYGNIVRVTAANYGNIGPQLDYNVVKGLVPGNLLFSANQTQNRGGVLVSLQDLGITTGQTIYGYSLLSSDLRGTATPANLVDYTNTNYYPTNTPSTGGIDLVAVTGMYIENSALPTNFVGFNATENQDKVALKWNVENETTVDRYVVERSEDGQLFSSVATVRATSNSTGANSYSYSDDVSGVSGNELYYRIKQYDRDGSYYLSKIVLIRRNQKADGLVIYPNPVKGNLFVNITSEVSQQTTVLVLNSKGQQVISEKMSLSKGNNTITVGRVNKLPSGVYQLTIVKADGKKLVHQFIKE